MALINHVFEHLFFFRNAIGSLLALLTVLLLLYYPSPLTPFLALILVFGVPLSWYLKKWGVFITIFSLTLLMIFNSNAIETPIWHLGVVLSMLLTLFIADNSFVFPEPKEDQENNLLIESLQKTLEQNKLNFENLKIERNKIEHGLQEKADLLFQELKIFQEKCERLQQDVDKDKEEILIAKNEMDAIKNELSAHKIKEEHVLQELLEKRREVFQLREQLQDVQEELKNRPLETKIVVDDTELINLRDLINKKDQDLFNLQFRLDSALEDIQVQDKELSKIQDAEMIQKKLQTEMADQIEVLKRERELLELTIHKLQHEIEQLVPLKQEKEKLELEKASTQEISKQADIEYSLRRRSEGMYLQLKEQFSSKSDILDDTRRQLFHTQENLLQWQLEIKENEQFSNNPQVETLIQHILKMQNQFDFSERLSNDEIDRLHAIISKLSCE